MLFKVYTSDHVFPPAADGLTNLFLLSFDLFLSELVDPHLFLPHVLLKVINHMSLFFDFKRTLFGGLDP